MVAKKLAKRSKDEEPRKKKRETSYSLRTKDDELRRFRAKRTGERTRRPGVRGGRLLLAASEVRDVPVHARLTSHEHAALLKFARDAGRRRGEGGPLPLADAIRELLKLGLDSARRGKRGLDRKA